MHQQNKQQPVIEDLAVNKEQADEVKGSLNYNKIHFHYLEQKPDSSL